MSIWNGPLLANIKRVFGVDGKNITEAVGNITGFNGKTGGFADLLVTAEIGSIAQQSNDSYRISTTDSITLDKTYAEIRAAIKNNQRVIVQSVGKPRPQTTNYFTLDAITDTAIIFSSQTYVGTTNGQYSLVSSSLWIRENSVNYEAIWTLTGVSTS